MKRATILATASGPARSRGSVVALVRLAVATFAVMLFSLVIYRPAYALSTNPGVEINGWSLTAYGMDGEEGYLVYAPDKFSAAAMALGYSWDDVQGFTADQKAYMSNQSSGGDFYVFASNFEKLSSDTPSIGDVPYAWAMGYLRSNQVIWGGRVYNDCYAVNTTRDMYSDARQKLEDILDGDVGGGTPSLPGDEGWYRFNLTAILEPYSGVVSQRAYHVTSVGLNNLTGKGTVNFGSAYENITWTAGQSIVCYVDPYSYELLNSQGMTNIDIIRSYGTTYAIVSSGSYEWVSDNYDSNYKIKNTSDSTINLIQFNGNNGNTTYFGYYKGQFTVFLNQAKNVRSFTVGAGKKDTTPYKPFWQMTGAGVVVPPTNWPDPPENPTVDPPSVPEPPSGPTVQPPTIPPQPTPTYPTPPVVVEPTVPAAPDLSDILDALNEHCIHLQDAMHREAENIDTDMRAQIGWLAGAISDTVESLDGDIELYFKHLEDYLYDLFHWLNDQLDFSFGEYDDTSVLYWLRMIYSKLGRGGPTTKPTDPVTDPFGIGEWLKQLIDNFLLDLIAIGAGDLADVIADFRDLATKFPFSVPWDLAAMLALLVAQPVTPVIDFPWYSYTASGLVSTTVHMDLSAWNATMEPIRLMEKLAFCMLLASRSKDLLDFIRLGRGDA